jgi:hypothetical protein
VCRFVRAACWFSTCRQEHSNRRSSAAKLQRKPAGKHGQCRTGSSRKHSAMLKMS